MAVQSYGYLEEAVPGEGSKWKDDMHCAVENQDPIL
jgi:hypothetical protein